MNDNPLVTIIISIRNEAAYIKGCLNAVLAQEHLGKMEILVVDRISAGKECFRYDILKL